MTEQTPTQPIFTPPSGNAPQPGASPYGIPQGMATTPPPPPTPQPRLPQQGGRSKKVLWITMIGLLVLGGGALAAWYFFPTGTNTNSNTNTTNTVTNANRNTNSVVSNTNRSNTNATNVNANVNTNSTANANRTVNANTNSAVNTNATTNSNSTNVNSSQPASFSTDTDGDTLNDYLEAWFATNPRNADSDGDGFPDGREVVNGYSPLGTPALSSAGAQAACGTSTLVTQLSLGSADVTALCTIASDILVSMQVMVANSQLYEDLDTKLSSACTAFKKVETATCVSTVKNVLIDYFQRG